MSSNTNATRRRTISPRGVIINLPGGGWFRVLPSKNNIMHAEKLRRLYEEARVANGLDLQANLYEILGLREVVTINVRALMGTSIFEWGGFDRDDGTEIPSFLADGSLDEEAGIEIMLFPGVSDEFGEAMKPINNRYVQDQEAAEGNSSEPSDGSSATVGS